MNTKRSIVWRVVLPLAAMSLLLSVACSDGDRSISGPVAATYLDDPHAGVWLEWYMGAVTGGEEPDLHWVDLLNIFPDPANPQAIMPDAVFDDPRYGNPHPLVDVYFELASERHVVLWIVRVDKYEDRAADNVGPGGAIAVVPKGYPVRVFLDTILPAGYHELTWDFTDEFGNLMPSGVYRIYVVAGDEADSKDLYFMWNSWSWMWTYEPQL